MLIWKNLIFPYVQPFHPKNHHHFLPIPQASGFHPCLTHPLVPNLLPHQHHQHHTLEHLLLRSLLFQVLLKKLSDLSCKSPVDRKFHSSIFAIVLFQLLSQVEQPSLRLFHEWLLAFHISY
jgi:hypothetical protein